MIADERSVTAFDWQASAGNDESWRGKGRQFVVRSGDYAGAVSATRVDAVFGSQVDAGAARPRDKRASGYRMDLETETFVVANGLRASDGHHGHSSPRGDGADNLIAFDAHNQDVSTTTTRTVRSTTGGGVHDNLIAQTLSSSYEASGVRRLTPLECERLMGWPDGHTQFTADGTEISDSHRYRMCGNGVVATVAEWLGHRLVRCA